MNEPAASAPSRQVWDVGALLLAAGDVLQARFGAVTVRGELSGLTRAASGHCYFSLKDMPGASALLRCAMFRRAAALLDFEAQDGQQVELRGRIVVYEPRGELQLVVESMQRLGAGALYEQFLRLKARLEAAGPVRPRAQAARAAPGRRRWASSPRTAAAALHDVLTALARRAPQVRVIIYPSPVQGADAAPRWWRRLRLAAATARGRHPAAGARRRLARRPVVLQRRAPGARHRRVADPGDLRRRPRERRHAGRPGGRPACRHADRRGRAGRTGPGRGAGAAARRWPRCCRGACSAACRHAGAAAGHAGAAPGRPGARARLAAAAAGLARRAAAAWRCARPRPARHASARSSARGCCAPCSRQQRAAGAAAAGRRAQRLAALDPQRVLARGYAWMADADGRPVLSARAVRPATGCAPIWADGRHRSRCCRCSRPRRPIPRRGRRHTRGQHAQRWRAYNAPAPTPPSPAWAMSSHRKDAPWNTPCPPCPSRWMRWRRT